MRLINRPYHLLLILASLGAMVFLLNKINKQSFYHHYFRVIEEVELRNSHELELSSDVAILTMSRSVEDFFVSLVLLLGITTGILLVILAPGLSGVDFPYVARPASQLHFLLQPVRAP